MKKLALVCFYDIGLADHNSDGANKRNDTRQSDFLKNLMKRNSSSFTDPPGVGRLQSKEFMPRSQPTNRLSESYQGGSQQEKSTPDTTGSPTNASAATVASDHVLASLCVAISPTHEVTLDILATSSPTQLARDFVQKHNLPISTLSKLEATIRDIIAADEAEEIDRNDVESLSDLSDSRSHGGEGGCDNEVISRQDDRSIKQSSVSASAAPSVPPPAPVPLRPLLSGMRQLSSAFNRLTTTKPPPSSDPPPPETRHVPHPASSDSSGGGAASAPPSVSPPSASDSLRTPMNEEGERDEDVLASLCVAISPTHEVTLDILATSSPIQLARDFVQKHDLPESVIATLEAKVREVILAAEREGGEEAGDDGDSEVTSLPGESSTPSPHHSESSSVHNPPFPPEPPPAKSDIAMPPPASSARSHADTSAPSAPRWTQGAPSPLPSLEPPTDAWPPSRRRFALDLKVSQDKTQTLLFHPEDNLLDVATRFVTEHHLPVTAGAVLAGKMQAMVADDESVRVSSLRSDTSSLPRTDATTTRAVRRDSDASRNAYNNARQQWGRDGRSESSPGSSANVIKRPEVAPQVEHDTAEIPRNTRGRRHVRQDFGSLARSNSASAIRRPAAADRVVRTSMVIGQPRRRARSASPGGGGRRRLDTFTRCGKR